jgi:AcrR family transcriptional regulator
MSRDEGFGTRVAGVTIDKVSKHSQTFAMANERMSSDARRAQILDAAMHEFSIGGYAGTSAAAIAARAGISQPYVFRLFGTKKELFVACIEERTRQIRAAMTGAAEASPDDPCGAMAAAYMALLLDDPVSLRSQLQAWASAYDPEIGEAARASYLSIWSDVGTAAGLADDEVRDFMAHGMLLTVLAALDLPHLYGDPSQPQCGAQTEPLVGDTKE